MHKKEPTDYRFKILYALGIIFVVAGHGAGGGLDSALTLGGWFPFYSFHLALFMFCSGYFYKINSHEHTLKYIWKKIKHLIVPLFLWNLVYACFVLILSNFGFKIGLPVTFEKLTTTVITNGNQFGFNLGSWFLVPLFMTQVVTVLIRKIVSKWDHWSKEWVLAIFYFGLGVLGIWLSRRGWNIGWPLVLTRMLSLMPFYGLGILYKTKLEKYDRLKSWLYFLIIFAIQLIVIVRSGGRVPDGAQVWSNYKSVISTIVIGVTGIALWLRIAKVLEPVIGKNKFVNLIADNTFSIMIHQFIGFWIVNLSFGLFMLATNLNGFNWDTFHSWVFYKFLPNNCVYFGVIYLAAGIIVPILIAKGCAFIKKTSIIVLSNWHQKILSSRPSKTE